MTTALVSTIIPVYNGEQYLQQAIASVLAQSCRAVEVIVVDDGSSDGTAKVVKSMSDRRVRYLYQPNQGAAIARNRGVEASTGTFLAFLDADDLWCQGKLAKQVARLEEEPELDMLFGYYSEFYSPESGDKTVSETVLQNVPETILMPGYSSGTMLIRRDAFLRVGFFSDEWRIGEFMEWYARATDFSLRHEMMTEHFLQRRVHQRNMGIERRAERVEYARLLRAVVERRKQCAASEAESGRRIATVNHLQDDMGGYI